MTKVTGKINKFNVEIYALVAGESVRAIAAENGITIRSNPDLFIDAIGGEDYEDILSWAFMNPSAFEILKTTDVNVTAIKTIMMVQSEA
jgi:hypothetical protein